MRNTREIISSIGLLFCGVVILALAASAIFLLQERAIKPINDANVQVVMNARGHGSGVHLGNGLVLTAGHVAKGDLTVVTETETTHAAEVLWSNPEYDVGLLKTNISALNKRADLSCRDPQVGEDVSMVGYPGNHKHMTVHGRVAAPIQTDTILWKRVISVDITAMGGNSGSPIYSTNGQVIGILVGGYPTPFPVRSFTLVVPGSTICMLLGR